MTTLDWTLCLYAASAFVVLVVATALSFADWRKGRDLSLKHAGYFVLLVVLAPAGLVFLMAWFLTEEVDWDRTIIRGRTPRP